MECQDFAKSAQRDVIDLSFGSRINLTSRVKKCQCIEGIRKKIIRKIFWGGSWNVWGGGGGGGGGGKLERLGGKLPALHWIDPAYGFFSVWVRLLLRSGEVVHAL